MNESDSADENIIDENLDIHVPTHSEQNLGEAIVHCELLPNPVLEKNTKKHKCRLGFVFIKYQLVEINNN